MKINLFRIPKNNAPNLSVDLEDNGYDIAAEYEKDSCYAILYILKKHSESNIWLDYYSPLLDGDAFEAYTSDIGSDSLSGVFLIETEEYAYAVVHGQGHFLVRKYCDKDFGLNLAERILDPEGLKMKHSQTFTSASKKDITSFTRRRAISDSREYGEAFNYVKCKTADKKLWGETIDCGESVRFTFGKDFHLGPTDLHSFIKRVDSILAEEPKVSLPRYRKVTSQLVRKELDEKLQARFAEYLQNIAMDDYWMTGVSFNFASDYHYSLKIRTHEMTDVLDTLDADILRKAVADNSAQIKGRYDLIRVVFHNEDGDPIYSKPLREMLQITMEHNKKYYVLFRNEWMEFSESYISFIEEQVDGIPFEFKDAEGKNEDDLIKSLVAAGKYTQLHKQNVHIGKYCIEKADLMDDNNIVMIKDQRQSSDLVYLTKQATTSIRLADAGQLGDNVFTGRNICLWMIVKRKSIKKLSDFRSFHLLDALNDFKREVINLNLTPVIWISLSGK